MSFILIRLFVNPAGRECGRSHRQKLVSFDFVGCRGVQRCGNDPVECGFKFAVMQDCDKKNQKNQLINDQIIML